jgi:hypothetical protein
MYHRFAKSLKRSNPTAWGMASNPGPYEDTLLEWLGFVELDCSRDVVGFHH